MIWSAATKFSVPRKTLDDRVKGRVTHGSKPGVSTALSSIQEDSLVSYLIYMANRGFPLTRTMVKAFTWSIAKRCGTADRFNSEYGPGENGGCHLDSGTLNWHFDVVIHSKEVELKP